MRRLHHTTFFLLIYIGVALSTCCRAEGKYPFMGDWQGRWDTKDKVYPPKLAARVFPWKGGSYQIRLFTELRRGAPEYVVIEAEPAGNVLSFDSDGWSGTIQGDNFTGGGTLRGRSGGFKMTRVAYESPRLGLKPPKNARVLFNGGSLDEWEMIPRTGETGTVTWAVEGDILKVAPAQGNHQMGASISTRGTFKDFLLHIEFRLPLLPDNTDQRRGNS